MKFRIWPIALGILAGACSHNPPLEDYTLARTALQAARRAGGNRYAPNYFHTAEEAFSGGETSFKTDDFDGAKVSFVKARQFAERAENIARLQKFRSGEVSP